MTQPGFAAASLKHQAPSFLYKGQSWDPLGEEESSGPFPDSTGFLALGQPESSLLPQEPKSVSSPSSGGQRTLCLLG